MNLKPTHQALFGTRGDVTAWRFDPKAEVPPWILRHFTRGEDKTIFVPNAEEANHGGFVLRVGEWAVAFPEEKKITILTDEEFTKNFRPL